MELHARFANAAKAKGIPMSELLTRLMQKEAAGYLITEEQLKDIDRRMKNSCVGFADITKVAVDNAAAIASGVANNLLRPTMQNALHSQFAELTPLPKLGSRKKKRQ